MCANSVSEFSVVFNFRSHEIRSKMPVNGCAGCSGNACVAKGNNNEEPNQPDARDVHAHGSSDVQGVSGGHQLSREQATSDVCAREEREVEQNVSDAEEIEERTEANSINDSSENVCSSVQEAQEIAGSVTTEFAPTHLAAPNFALSSVSPGSLAALLEVDSDTELRLKLHVDSPVSTATSLASEPELLLTDSKLMDSKSATDDQLEFLKQMKSDLTGMCMRLLKAQVDIRHTHLPVDPEFYWHFEHHDMYWKINNCLTDAIDTIELAYELLVTYPTPQANIPEFDLAEERRPNGSPTPSEVSFPVPSTTPGLFPKLECPFSPCSYTHYGFDMAEPAATRDPSPALEFSVLHTELEEKPGTKGKGKKKYKKRGY